MPVTREDVGAVFLLRVNKSEANRTPAYDFEDQYTTIILRSFVL